MLNTSYFSNKLMVRIANIRLFSYTFSCVLRRFLSHSLVAEIFASFAVPQQKENTRKQAKTKENRDTYTQAR
jgi:hypothetical protein